MQGILICFDSRYLPFLLDFVHSALRLWFVFYYLLFFYLQLCFVICICPLSFAVVFF